MNKKIVFLINSLAGGGAERVVSTLLNYLVEEYDCFLILIENQIVYNLDKRVNIINLNEDKNNSELLKFLRLPIIVYKFNKIIKKYKFETIVSFLYRANYINALATFLNSHKVIISERTMANDIYKETLLKSIVHKFLIKKLYNKADYIIAVSKLIENNLTSNFNVNANKTVIYNPCDLARIKKLAEKTSKIKTHKKNNIISVGSLIDIKNFTLLIKSIANTKQKFYLYILGIGGKERNLKKITKSLKINDKVIFLGFDNNPYKYLSKCSIFILSSNKEGFPNVIAEAMACGCAIISTDCPSGPREILAPNSNINIQLKNNIELAEYGILTPVNNVEKMTEAIELMLSNKALRKDFSKKSTKRIEDFHINHIIKKYKQVLCVD